MAVQSYRLRHATPPLPADCRVVDGVLPFGVEAQTTWTGTGEDTDFSNSANWNNTTAPTNNGSAALTFGDTGFGSINVDTPYSVSSLTFNGSSTIYGFSGNTLSVASAITSSATVGVNFTNSIQLTGASTFSTGTSNLNFNAIDTGANNLTLSATGGALSVNGNLTGTGALTISGSAPGVVFLTSTGNAWSGGTTINSGATLQIGDPGGTSAGSLPGDVTDNGTLNLKASNTSFTYGGVISGSGRLQVLGTNTLTLTNPNTYAGQTTVASGTLAIGVLNALPTTTALGVGSATVDVANNQTIDHFAGTMTSAVISIASGKTFTVSPVSAGSSNYNGTLSGSGQLVINGVAGSKVQLFGDSSGFTGLTTVNGGQLGLHNSAGSALGSGNLVINSGAKLEGSGGFTGALTLNSGSSVTVDPHLSVGATTFNGGSSYIMLLGDATGTAGVDTSLLSVGGGLTFGDASPENPITITPVSFSGGSPGLAANFDTTQSYSFTLATTTTPDDISGLFDASDFVFDMSKFQNAFTGTWWVASDGTNLILNYTGGSAIPEPVTSALLAGVAACGLAVWRRAGKIRPAV